MVYHPVGQSFVFIETAPSILLLCEMGVPANVLIPIYFPYTNSFNEQDKALHYLRDDSFLNPRPYYLQLIYKGML